MGAFASNKERQQLSMCAQQIRKTTKLVAFLSLFFGCTGLLLCATYEAQRAGLLIYSLSRFVQQHLDAFGGWALLLGVAGMLAGLIILHFRDGSGIVICGIVISIIASLWSGLALPL